MYEKRFVLFLDILGFQKIIEETEKKDEPQQDKINDIIALIEDMKTVLSRMPEQTSKIVTQFSDSIVVSFKENDRKEITSFLKSVHELTVKLASKNILCRGAVSYGNVYHKDNVIFGPALVDAYLTESQAAIYPRVIFDKSVIEIMKSQYVFNGTNNYQATRFDGNIDSLLKTDLDDRLYFDFIAKAGYYYENDNLLKYYNSMRQNIINGLRFKSPSIKAKFSWLKNKYNQLPDNFYKLNEEEELYYKRPDILEFIKKFKAI